MPDAPPNPYPPYAAPRPCHVPATLTEILTISALAVVLAAVRQPACPVKEPAHAWQR